MAVATEAAVRGLEVLMQSNLSVPVRNSTVYLRHRAERYARDVFAPHTFSFAGRGNDPSYCFVYCQGQSRHR